MPNSSNLRLEVQPEEDPVGRARRVFYSRNPIAPPPAEVLPRPEAYSYAVEDARMRFAALQDGIDNAPAHDCGCDGDPSQDDGGLGSE